jgi:hypothetical protein
MSNKNQINQTVLNSKGPLSKEDITIFKNIIDELEQHPQAEAFLEPVNYEGNLIIINKNRTWID